MDSQKRRILLISCFFYPQNRIPVLRVGQWAKYWALQGHEVTVLTTRKYGFEGPFGLEPDLPDSVAVIEVPYLPGWLQRRMERTTPPGQAATATDGATSTLKTRLRSLRKTIGSNFDIHDLWVSAAYKAGMALMASNKHDAIVSSFSPPAAHTVASKLKKAYPDLIWFADFRDLWANNHITSAKGIFRRLESRRERRTLNGLADGLITVSQPLADDLRSRYGDIPVWVIENGFDPDEFPGWADSIAAQHELKSGITICYAGTIYPKRRDPTPLFLAVNTLIDEGIISPQAIRLEFYGQNERELRQIIQQSDANRHGIIRVNGFVNRQASLDAQKRSNLLLLLESGEPSARGVLTGKLFEYLVSGIPILGVGIDHRNAAGALLESTGTGYCSSDSQQLQELLLAAIAARRFEFYQPKQGLIARYARDVQARSIIEKLASLQGAPSC
jgi:hypothetical protein